MAGGIFAGNISNNHNETIEVFEDIIGEENVKISQIFENAKSRKC